MALVAMKDDGEIVNRKLFLKAFENHPSLILDCGNMANPHNLFPMVREEQLHDVYVMNAEAIYRFRDALRQIPYWVEKLKIRCIIITTIQVLFSYDDEEENHDVLEHCWELMKEISKTCTIYIAYDDRNSEFAERFADEIVI
jgi:hypothetical protein